MRPSSSVHDSKVFRGACPPSSLTRMPLAGFPTDVSRTWQVMGSLLADIVSIRTGTYFSEAQGELELCERAPMIRREEAPS